MMDTVRPFALNALLRALCSALLSLLTMFSAACSNESVSGNATVERYRYRSDQRTPFVAVLSGVLTVSRTTSDRFDGSLDVLQTNPNGQVERRAGIVRGRLTAGAMDFDVMLDSDVYRHVGRSLADTVAGNWLDVSAVGNLASGTFRLERTP